MNMKRFIVLCFVAISFFASAQDYEPEVKYTGEGKITMMDGKELTGELTYSFVSIRNLIFVAPGAEKEKIKTNDIKEFTISGTRFVRIVTTAISIGKDWEFAICLTPENSKISIFESINQTGLETGSGYKTERGYFVKFPNEEKAKSLSDLSLTPFHKKVSKIIADCPALSEKIANKAEGYKLGLISTPQQQFDVFMKVATEYQDCK